MAHAEGTAGIKAAVRAGVDSIEHGTMLDDETAAMMEQRGTWLVPTLLGKRRNKARTKGRVTRLIAAAGLNVLQWHDLNAVIIRAVIATK